MGTKVCSEVKKSARSYRHCRRVLFSSVGRGRAGLLSKIGTGALWFVGEVPGCVSSRSLPDFGGVLNSNSSCNAIKEWFFV